MKNRRSLMNRLMACGIALALVSTLAAQAEEQGSAKVVRIKGNARYTTGNNVWQPLKVGDVIKPGTLIQTANNSSVDLMMGEGAVPSPRAAIAAPQTISYQATADQNMLRIAPDSALAIDKLTSTQTGADVVTDTQLDLQRGRILGNVKKMNAASKFEIKIPNGVAGIRGTMFDVSAEGVIKVYVGSMVIAYVSADGTVVTQVVVGNQQFDARTGTLTPLPPTVVSDGINTIRGFSVVPTGGVIPIVHDHTLSYVSPK